MVPPADRSNFGGVEIYLHWIEGWNADGTPIYDARYLPIEHTGREGGPWHANESGFPLDGPDYSQQVDVVFVPNDARGIEAADKASCFSVRLTVSSAIAETAPDVVFFRAGTIQPDGTFLAEPRWDTLNEQMIIDWGCFLPPDLAKFRGVSVFIQLPNGEYVKAPRGADGEDTEPQAGAPFLDSFAIEGDDVPKTPEDWILIACSMNQYGRYNVDAQGNPTGPSLTLRTVAPNGGVTGENLNPNAVGQGIILNGPLIEFGTTTPDNMIINPDFEYGFEKWAHGGAQIVTTGAYTGSQAAKLAGDGAYAVQHFFHVRPLDRLTLDAWVKADPGTTGSLNLIIRGWNATLSQYTDFAWKTQAPVSVWTKVSASITIPADSPYTLIEVYAPWISGYTTGAWYVDNVCFRREVSLGNGLAYDSAGNLKIPDVGISREMLEQQIVGIDQLENAAIIKDAHIIRAGVNRLIVLDADIASLRANAITAGTLSATVFYGGAINCNQINAGTLYAVNLNGGTLDLNANGIRTLLNHSYSATTGNYVGLTTYASDTGAGPIYLRPGQIWCYENVNDVWDYSLNAYRAPYANWRLESTQWLLFRPASNGYGVQIMRDVEFCAIKIFDPNDLAKVTLTSSFGGRIYVGADMYVGSNKVLGGRKTGWTLPTGTARRTGFNTATATVQEVAETVCALLQDLHSTAGHGLIGA